MASSAKARKAELSDLERQIERHASLPRVRGSNANASL